MLSLLRHLTPAGERRRQPRFVIGLPVRLLVDGQSSATTVELRDVSTGGGFLCTEDDTPQVLADQDVAIGLVLPTQEVGLARGRVLRVVPGLGFAVSFADANGAFEQYVAALLDGAGGLPT